MQYEDPLYDDGPAVGEFRRTARRLGLVLLIFTLLLVGVSAGAAWWFNA